MRQVRKQVKTTWEKQKFCREKKMSQNSLINLQDKSASMKPEQKAIKKKKSRLQNKKYILKIKNVKIEVKSFVQDWKIKLRKVSERKSERQKENREE